MADNRHIDFANWEIFVIALSRVGGDADFVDIETAFVEAHHLAPHRFCWRTRTELPEIKKLSKALRDADAKGNLMTRTSDGHKRQLKAEGLRWLQNNTDRVAVLVDDPRYKVGVAKSQSGAKYLRSLVASDEFKRWKEGGPLHVERWRLAEIFRCSPDSHEEVWATRLAQTGSAAHAQNLPDVVKFTTLIASEIAANE